MGKQWFGAMIFYKGSEEIEVDVFKKLEKRKVLSNVEKVGLLLKIEELGFTLSSIEKLGVFFKEEGLGLLSLVEKVVGVLLLMLTFVALLTLMTALAVIVIISDDSVGLVAVQVVVVGALVVGVVGLFVRSVVLGLLETLRGILQSLLFSSPSAQL
ncbi:hypothetical protein J1N35_014989, partial [Gossypium stocksii]